MTKDIKDRFIPCTAARAIGDGVFFRPIRSWHSATYAGENLTEMPGGGDRSGCIFPETFRGIKVCQPPYTVTHRLYWHEHDLNKTLSAFLSYPDAMGCSDGEYFWEVFGINPDDVTRYFGDSAEAEMEDAIRKHFAAEVAVTENT
jgi:hypothetical protein